MPVLIPLAIGAVTTIGAAGMAAAPALAIGAGVLAAGATGYMMSEGEKAQERAKAAAGDAAAAERLAAQEAQEAAQMTTEEKAFQSMMMKRAEAGLGAPEFETTTAMETEAGLEALQKFFMGKGWQPSLRETGLLIEPSQKVARDVATQNALLRRQAQQQAWERAYSLYPQAQRQIEQQAPLQTLPTMAGAAGLPGRTEAGMQLQNLQDIQASQRALGEMLAAYSSPLLQQRITTGGGGGLGGPRVDPATMSRQYWSRV